MKERLTGAIILVALVVVLVPELLSGPKSPTAQHPISSSDGAPIQSVVIHLSEPLGSSTGAGTTGAAPTPAPTSEPTPTGASTSAPTPALVAAAPEPAPPTALPTQAGSSTSQPEASDAPPAEVPTPAAAARKPPAAKATPPAKAAPPPPPPPAPVAPARTGEAFLVQAGIFSNRGNANRLVHELSEHGLDAHLAVLRKGAGELFQVKVGPAGDRPAATALLGRVKAAGSSGMVVPETSRTAAGP